MAETFTLAGTTWQGTLFTDEDGDGSWSFKNYAKIRETVRKQLVKIAAGKSVPIRRKPTVSHVGFPRTRWGRLDETRAYIEAVGHEPRSIGQIVLARGGSYLEARAAEDQWNYGRTGYGVTKPIRERILSDSLVIAPVVRR